MKQTQWILWAVLAIALLLGGGAQAIDINVANDAEWQAAAPASGDRVVFAAGTFNLSAQKAVVDNVTYIGAGKGVTILDGGRVMR